MLYRYLIALVQDGALLLICCFFFSEKFIVLYEGAIGF
ncbi:hypothetical protein STRCR_0178 [Streptococcus criceti HS-6]|uniref:Uncharacterized protein n=1 Tax=Streptococcus criceti HS-6 TaxID=873449 RepID=G5JNE1_STRCG|nr:hypothetical protein STRCR_0178 [Streptococcus criceti HS-6]